MADFLQRLKQRKLVQWAIAYVAGAWAVLQALGLAADSYDWPHRVMQVAFAAIALGFVITLLLAWYHGEQGRQRVSGMELLLVALVLAVGGAWLWRFEHASQATGAASAGSTIAAAVSVPTRAEPAATATGHSNTSTLVAVIPAKSVAVLPFENLSTDKGNAYFADGMQDLILTKLADIGDLKVISRTSTEKYKSHPDSLKDIAQQLGVATILEGSVQKAGNQVLINVQLIDAKTDSHIWAQSYTRTLDNIFGVEGEVAGKIAQALNAKLTPAESAAVAKVGTHNQAALEAYLKGVYYLDDSNRTGDMSELARSVPLLKQAIAADPNYMDAWALLALAYEKLGGHAVEQDAAARHALTLDPGSADAHTEYAFALTNEGKFDPAIAEAEKALALSSHTASNIDALGFTLLFAGKIEASAQAFQRAVVADPHVDFSRTWAAITRAMLRDYPAARTGLRYVVAHNPGNANAVSDLAKVELLGWGDIAAARKALQSAATPVASSAALSNAWYALDFAARDYPAALAVLAQAPAASFTRSEFTHGEPRALYEALVYRTQGDAGKAQTAFAAARDELKAKLKAAPDDSNLHANLAQALAGLGSDAAAVAEAKRAVALLPVGKRGWTKPGALVNLASVEAHTGRAGDAIQVLGQLLSMPAGMDMSAEDLRINPDWDPLRNDPRFKALLKQYARSAPASADSAGTASTVTGVGND